MHHPDCGVLPENYMGMLHMLKVMDVDCAELQGIARPEQLKTACRCQVSGWELREDEQKRLRLRRRLVAKNFAAGLQLCQRIGELAEAEGHHPDFHLTVSGGP